MITSTNKKHEVIFCSVLSVLFWLENLMSCAFLLLWTCFVDGQVSSEGVRFAALVLISSLGTLEEKCTYVLVPSFWCCFSWCLQYFFVLEKWKKCSKFECVLWNRAKASSLGRILQVPRKQAKQPAYSGTSGCWCDLSSELIKTNEWNSNASLILLSGFAAQVCVGHAGKNKVRVWNSSGVVKFGNQVPLRTAWVLQPQGTAWRAMFFVPYPRKKKDHSPLNGESS